MDLTILHLERIETAEILGRPCRLLLLKVDLKCVWNGIRRSLDISRFQRQKIENIASIKNKVLLLFKCSRRRERKEGGGER